MKKLLEIALAAIAALWLASGLPVAAQKAGRGDAPKQARTSKEPVYRFLNPRGIPGPIEVRGLAPRLDTIKGKTIYVVVCEAGPQTGPFLYQYLKEKYPDTNWVRIQHNGFGPTDPAQDGNLLKEAHAVIGGQSW